MHLRGDEDTLIIVGLFGLFTSRAGKVKPAHPGIALIIQLYYGIMVYMYMFRLYYFHISLFC